MNNFELLNNVDHQDVRRTLEAEGEPGVGARFTVTIPVEPFNV